MVRIEIIINIAKLFKKKRDKGRSCLIIEEGMFHVFRTLALRSLAKVL